VNRLKTAVIGAGRLGTFHAQKLAQADHVDLVAVVDPLPECRHRVAAACHARALPDHRPLLDQIDAAVIATPTKVHHKVAMEFLQAGVHLLVEKPLCCTRAEADQLVEAAGRRNLVLQVGHVERFNPAFSAVASVATDPKYIEAVRAGEFTFRSTDVGVGSARRCAGWRPWVCRSSAATKIWPTPGSNSSAGASPRSRHPA